MFVGHLAVAIAAKRWEPDVNLAWLVAGATALDLIWPIFLLTGLETASIAPGAMAFTPITFDSYPWSHSLVMVFVWGLLLVAIARITKVPSSAWTLLAALVLSHWVLDVVSHAPDMPIWPGDGPEVGLGLWNSIPATFAIEGALWVAGIAVYMNTLARRGQRPGWLFWAFVVVCTVMWMTSPYSAPPPDIKALGWFALIGWIVIPWTALADRMRRQRSSIGAAT
jgi:membrane-bound metal-dependent hydrolase YbcI (DUF457 family)